MAKKSSNYTGVYIDYNTISVSIAEQKSDKILIRKIFNINVDYKVEGLIKPLSLNSDFFNEKQQWVSTLKDTFKKVKIDTNHVIISLSHNFSVTRFFTMPYIERKFWNKAVPIESKKHIPVAFEELGYDFYAEPIGEKQKIGALFSVTQKKTTEFLNQLFKTLGLSVSIIEPVVYTFYRISQYLTGGKDNYLFVYTEGDEVYTCLVWNKIPIMYRYISFSKTPSFSDRRSLDLKGSIMFLQRNIPDTDIKDVFIFGNSVDVTSSQVKKEIQTEPVIINPKDKFEPQDNSFGMIMSASASLTNRVKIDYIIDISENQRSKRVIDSVNKFITIITVGIATFFLFLYLFNMFRVYKYSNKISYYYSQMPEINEFENTPVGVIEDKVKQLSKIAKVIRVVFEKREYFTPKIAAIADTIPKDVWVKTITFVNPPSVDPSVQPSIDFMIEGETYLVGESRTYYLDYFVKELKKREAFKTCIPPLGRIDYEAKDPDNISDISMVQKDYRNYISKIKVTCNGKK